MEVFVNNRSIIPEGINEYTVHECDYSMELGLHNLETLLCGRRSSRLPKK